MLYVNAIRRIIALEAAYLRASDYCMRHEECDLDFAIADKADLLRSQLRGWISSAGDRTTRRRREAQVRLACNLLGVDYYRTIR